MSFFPQQKAELTLPSPVGNGLFPVSSPCSLLLWAVVSPESLRGFLSLQERLFIQNKRVTQREIWARVVWNANTESGQESRQG